MFKIVVRILEVPKLQKNVCVSENLNGGRLRRLVTYDHHRRGWMNPVLFYEERMGN